MKRGGLLAVLALLAIPAGASADVLYDQTTGTPGLTAPSSAARTPAPTDAVAADDFVVPTGVIWNLTSVDVRGQATSAQAGNVVLFADAGGLPTSELFRQGGIPFPAGTAQSLPVSGVPPLPPGHYWLSVYTTWTGAPWTWRLQSPTAGYPAVWENPSNGARTGCSSFAPLAQCGFPPADGTDLVFQLNGTASPIVQRARAPRCGRRHRRQHTARAKVRRCRRKKH